ncbi:YopX family protein [Clostridium sp.]|uniref:YopX family protein n=1 Tax=Clostridium sp. TaxID=1506 RepID=UPI0025C37F66|nr:YopX family protein [Clostridium sp.]MCI2201053.1 YopX family protein [Clostridium sp.]
MRKIKFRAYIKKLGKIVNVEEINFSNETIGVKVPGEGYLLVYNFKDFELMQYTGLKDKNGVEVYEGDILKLFYGKENTPLTTTKVFFNKEGYWDSKNLSEQHPVRACYGGFNKCEVIGNIYENPELLEGEENASN